MCEGYHSHMRKGTDTSDWDACVGVCFAYGCLAQGRPALEQHRRISTSMPPARLTRRSQ